MKVRIDYGAKGVYWYIATKRVSVENGRVIVDWVAPTPCAIDTDEPATSCVTCFQLSRVVHLQVEE